MNMTEAVKSVFSKYATFTGRARRAEFWWFALASFLVSLVLGFVDDAVLGFQSTGPLEGIWSLAVLIPSLAVGARRLHDIGKSGWFLLLALIPIIGWAVLIWWNATAGNVGPNQYGDDPMTAAPAV